MARPLYRLPEGVSCAGQWPPRPVVRQVLRHVVGRLDLRTAGETNPKLTWITSATGDVGSAQDLRDYAERFANLVDARGGEYLIAASESRFVTGLGRVIRWRTASPGIPH